MNVTPVIVRELRAEARNPVNYWIRVIAAALLLLPVAFFGLVDGFTTSVDGRVAFVLFTSILFVAAWIIIPVTISDCISRERREGTLGLLFLTPLNAREILLGKSAVNIARSLIVFLAALPILAIPILMGGVSPEDILRATFFNGAALVLAIAASLMASAVSKHRTRALILSLGLCVLFLFVCFLLPITILLELPFELEPLFRGIFGGESQLGNGPGDFAPAQVAGMIFLLSLLTLIVVILFCSARLQRNWQDNPMSARQQKVYRLFCSPRFLLSFFKKWQQRKLTRNPVGWLQSYSWSSRLSIWGWCGVIIVVESLIVITSNYRMLATSQNVLQSALFVSIAFSAVNSFQRERQTGALELILVTPIREKELILGRLRGIWGQFLPAFLVSCSAPGTCRTFFRTVILIGTGTRLSSSGLGRSFSSSAYRWWDCILDCVAEAC
ncbi:MAG: ABC transporter permease subunit [Verrucomicrobia bacterium]|nr:ABC transporter permease subunit [Verrucomicrobiota bacterium]